MINSSVAPSPGISATIAPSRTTRIRSHSPRCSVSSLDVVGLSRRRPQNHATGDRFLPWRRRRRRAWLLDHKQVDAGCEPPADHDFLLVAAGKRRDERLLVAGAYVHFPHHRSDPGWIKLSRRDEGGAARHPQSDISFDRERRKGPFQFTVLGNEANSRPSRADDGPGKRVHGAARALSRRAGRGRNEAG